MVRTDKNRWFIVCAGILILICLGVAYAWGVFLVPIDQDLGWGRAKVSMAVSILLFVFSVFMVIGGLCEKRFGPRKTVTAGGLFIMLSWLLSSYANTPLHLYLTYGLLGGIGTGLSYMPAISTSIKWFPDKKGLITGLVVFGFGFGAAFLSPLATNLIGSFGWRTTMMIYGIAFGIIIVTAAQFFSLPPTTTAQAKAASGPRLDFSPGQMLGTTAFKMMFFTYFLAMVAGMMTIGHISAFCQDKGSTAIQAAYALTILAISNGAGRILCGYLSDKIGSKNILTLLFLAIGFSMLSLYHLPGLYTTYAVAAIIGLCFGGFLAVYPPLTVDYFGSSNFGINYGLVFIGYGTGSFFGPWLGGIIFDSTSSYLAAFNIAGVLALLGAALAYRLSPAERDSYGREPAAGIGNLAYAKIRSLISINYFSGDK